MQKFLGKKLFPVFILIGGSIVFYIIYSLKKRKKKDIHLNSIPILEEHVSVPCEKKILFLGLNNAGKSTLLQRLSRTESVMQKTKPTEGFNVVCVHTSTSVSLNYWEIGGGVGVRGYWSKFLDNTCLLVFVVDSADQLRLSDAANELHKIAANSSLKGVPILVVASKQDVSSSVSAEAMEVILDLTKLRIQGHVVKVEPLLMSPETPFHPSIKTVEDKIICLCGIPPTP